MAWLRMPTTAAMERENESRGPSAEKLANPDLAGKSRIWLRTRRDLDRMWTHMMLLDEHTWTASNSITDPTSLEVVNQLAVKDSHAVDAKALAASLVRNSMASIVGFDLRRQGQPHRLQYLELEAQWIGFESI